MFLFRYRRPKVRYWRLYNVVLSLISTKQPDSLTSLTMLCKIVFPIISIISSCIIFEWNVPCWECFFASCCFFTESRTSCTLSSKTATVSNIAMKLPWFHQVSPYILPPLNGRSCWPHSLMASTVAALRFHSFEWRFFYKSFINQEHFSRPLRWLAVLIWPVRPVSLVFRFFPIRKTWSVALWTGVSRNQRMNKKGKRVCPLHSASA